MPGKKRVPPGRTCKSCRKNSNIYAFVSPFSYSNHAARELVHYLKYRRVRETAGVISEILDEHLNHFGIKFYKDTFIIPVPLHKSRERTRGFNQAELIAKKLDSMNLKKMVLTGVLLRHKNTRSQIDLTREEKETNVGGAFMVLNPGLISGKTAILVDDVKTTGATIDEAARILKDAGAKRIWAITVAH
jgi:competence protein ComFC